MDSSFHKIFSFSTKKYAKLWVILALLCLFYSGAIALVITFAKLPILSEYVKNIDIIRWTLVIHVNLATVMWFTAFPLGLLYNKLSYIGKTIGLPQIIGYFLAVFGVFLVVIDFPNKDMQIYMSNYVPVLSSNQFFLGMSLYLSGAGISFLFSPVFKKIRNNSEYFVGSIFFLTSLVVLIFSFTDLYFVENYFKLDFHEKLWWGFGHLLQHASSAFCLLCWCLLLITVYDKNVIFLKHKFNSFLLLLLPIIFIPLFILESPAFDSYRQNFTYLMQYGIFPGIFYFIFFHKDILFNKRLFKNDYRFRALNFSIFLMLLGFIFGSMIRGSDLRIPAHYHAVIGAVSLSFMVVCYEVFVQKKYSIKWMWRSINIFTIGQIIFSSALFLAGWFGYERKAYADENTVTTIGQHIIFLLMPIGGLLAFLGGLCFAIAICKDRKYII